MGGQFLLIHFGMAQADVLHEAKPAIADSNMGELVSKAR
jgi:hypothetical protein